jgi:hypothetical protein
VSLSAVNACLRTWRQHPPGSSVTGQESHTKSSDQIPGLRGRNKCNGQLVQRAEEGLQRRTAWLFIRQWFEATKRRCSGLKIESVTGIKRWPHRRGHDWVEPAPPRPPGVPGSTSTNLCLAVTTRTLRLPLPGAQARPHLGSTRPHLGSTRPHLGSTRLPPGSGLRRDRINGPSQGQWHGRPQRHRHVLSHDSHATAANTNGSGGRGPDVRNGRE